MYFQVFNMNNTNCGWGGNTRRALIKQSSMIQKPRDPDKPKTSHTDQRQSDNKSIVQINENHKEQKTKTYQEETPARSRVGNAAWHHRGKTEWTHKGTRENKDDTHKHTHALMRRSGTAGVRWEKGQVSGKTLRAGTEKQDATHEGTISQ